MTNNDLGLIPIRNFGTIDEARQIYRSAQPEYEYEYAWLKSTLGLDYIVNLRTESSHDTTKAPKHGIKVVNIRVPDHNPPTHKQALDFITLLNSNPNKSFLIHCEHGRGRTSTFSVLAKLALGWTLGQALKDEERRFHYAFKYKHQIEFLEEYFRATVLAKQV